MFANNPATRSAARDRLHQRFAGLGRAFSRYDSTCSAHSAVKRSRGVSTSRRAPRRGSCDVPRARAPADRCIRHRYGSRGASTASSVCRRESQPRRAARSRPTSTSIESPTVPRAGPRLRRSTLPLRRRQQSRCPDQCARRSVTRARAAGALSPETVMRTRFLRPSGC